MMTSTSVYDKALQLIKLNFDKGDEVGMVKISTLIIKMIGGQKRTVDNTLKVMLQTHLIKDIGNMHFKIL